jgi:GT2 family glycosyltransferase
MKKIGIIIVNYKGEKDTSELLDSLEKIQTVRYSLGVYILDNSSNSEIDWQGRKIAIQYRKNSKNVGFAAANNQGIKWALKENCDYVCLLNNDTTVSPDFLQNLFNFFEQNENIGIASPKIYFSAGHEFHKDKYENQDLGKIIWYAGGIIDWKNVYCSHRGVDEIDHGQFDEIENTDFATGCCMFIRKEVFEVIGDLDEKYFAYFEDVDLCVRAKKAAYLIKYIPDSIIWHKNASSSGGSGSSLHFFLQERNRIYFGFKYASLKTKIHLLAKLIAYIFSKNYKIGFSAAACIIK